jgi:hypothetical protein
VAQRGQYGTLFYGTAQFGPVVDLPDGFLARRKMTLAGERAGPRCRRRRFRGEFP